MTTVSSNIANLHSYWERNAERLLSLGYLDAAEHYILYLWGSYRTMTALANATESDLQTASDLLHRIFALEERLSVLRQHQCIERDPSLYTA